MNLARSLMAPETMVAAVAANTTWNIRLANFQLSTLPAEVIWLRKKSLVPKRPGGAGPEHQAVADQEKAEGTQGEIDHVLHDHVARVLGPGESHFHQGEAGLHEKNQEGGDAGSTSCPWRRHGPTGS